MNKREVLELVAALPDDVDVDRLIYTLWLKRKLEKAFALPEEDDISEEAMERLFDQWLA